MRERLDDPAAAARESDLAIQRLPLTAPSELRAELQVSRALARQQLAGTERGALLAVVADPVRWRILSGMSAAPRCVCVIQEDVDISPSLLSYHLKVLRDRGMVTATRMGAAVEYQLADHRLIEALDLLRAILRDSLTRRAGLVDAFKND